jgi:anthranilate synthase component 1
MSAVPDLDAFRRLAREHSVIPVARDFFADTLTPVSAYRAVRGPWSFLLESVEHGERWGRFSFIGTEPLMTLTVREGAVATEPADLARTGLLGTLREALSSLSAPDLSGLPPLHSGFVGYIGYDTIRELERLGTRPPADLGITETALMFPKVVVAFDHLKQKVTIVVNVIRPPDADAAYADAVAAIDAFALRLFSARADAPRDLLRPSPIPAEPNVDDETYRGWVETAKEHVFAGDVFQVVLSRRFTAEAPADPFDAYRALRTINPSPYMYFLDMGDVQVAGSSPEVLVKVQGDAAVTHPIAGTRRRGGDELEDRALEEELLADPKERAEHVMLVDLARNDLGRVSAPGTVRVDDLMVIERYSHVMHIASRVSGRLGSGRTALDAFAAAFPAGTVSGAPKVRAMQIIDATEPAARGPYAGAVGYFDLAGNLDTCITLRTVLFHGGKAHVQAGAGIVADSDPAAEAKETRDKAEALLAAVGAATRMS